MYVKLGSTVRGVFGTNAFADGSATNADSTPTCVVLDQGTAMSYAPTVTNKATGLYEVAVVATSGNGFTAGHEYSLYVVVTLGAKVTRSPVEGVSSFNVVNRDTDDLGFPATSGRSTLIDASGQVTVGAYASGQAPLQPTVAGRTLGVDASGQVTLGTYASGKNPGGQIKPNSKNDKYVYDTFKRMTSCRVRVFASKAAADAATDGAADNAESEIERYIITVTYNADGTVKTYEFAKAL